MAESGGKIKAHRGNSVRLDEARARELYDAGCCDVEIARQLGVAKSTPFYWRRRNGLPPITPADRGWKSEVIRLMKAGWSDRDIVKKLGCDESYPRVLRREAWLGDEVVRERNRYHESLFRARHNALIGRGRG